MRLLNLTLSSAEENLALEEALLDEAEQRAAAGDAVEMLRLWEPKEPLVVVGRSSQVAREVHLDECRSSGVKVLRRTSGGAAIVAGPGCLMYALVFSYRLRPALRSLDAAHRLVLETHRDALTNLAGGIDRQGTSDLAIDQHKFSGNSVRCKRHSLLYHGTLLYDFPLEWVSRLLAEPPRQPDYRRARRHEDFVANLPATAAELRQALITAWKASEKSDAWPKDRVGQLVEEKYSQAAWNLR